DKQKTKLLPQVKAYFKDELKGKTIAMWGLAFKPHTDDIREAPALYNIKSLRRAGAKIVVFDPEAMENIKREIGRKVKYAKSMYDALEGADALMIMTEWPEFRSPDFEKMGTALKNKVIFDGRNLYDLENLRSKGFTYHSVGRKSVEQ
ncbi:MAG: UDPglucose 6-dehydrogenase, partial [Arcticibacterium sp.]